MTWTRYARRLIFWAVCLTITAALAQVDTAWTRRFNGPGSAGDEAFAMALDRNGNICVTGYSMGIGSAYDYQTVKYDPSGAQQWTARYTTAGDSNDQAFAIAVDDVGNVCVTGYTAAGNLDYLTVCYDTSGGEQWARRYNGPSLAVDAARAIATDHAGNVFVTGYSIGTSGNTDFLTLKYDPSGNLLWEARYDGPDNGADYPMCVAVDNAGNSYVAGYSWASSGGYDFLTIKYRGSTGELLWARRYNGLGNSLDIANALAVDSAGNVYVAGASMGLAGMDYDIAVVKYDSGGMQRWVTRYNGPGSDNDGANAIAVDATGNVFVTGYSAGLGTGSDLVVLCYDVTGTERWVRRYNGPGNNSDIGTALVLDSADNVYVTGYSIGSGTGYDYATFRFDSSGNQQWLMRYNNSPVNGSDIARSVRLDRWNNVYVTGSSYNGSGTNTDYLTIKYIQPDAAVSAIIEPTTRTDTSRLITPQATIRNLGSDTADIWVAFAIRNQTGAQLYYDTAQINAVGPGSDTSVTFRPWPKPYLVGLYTAFCSTWVAHDGRTENDTLQMTFTITCGPYGWTEIEPVPTAPSGRQVKDGGAFCYNPTHNRLFAIKGYKTGDYYTYNLITNTWIQLPQVPVGPSNKLPKAGAALTTDGNNCIYLTKGNNTLEFWRYDIDSAKWVQRADVPLTPSGKKLKAGTDAQFVWLAGTGYIYLLKGYRNDFYRYNTLTDVWENLPSAPAPANPRYDKGSFLVYDGQNIFYAAKARTGQIYRYYISTNTWDTVPVTTVPLASYTGQAKKLKDGGCATWFQDAIYCLKGGNTCEFWKYDVLTNTWTELDTMPSFGSTGKKKRVKAGGDIVSVGGTFYALKGNKTCEVWRYATPPSGDDGGGFQGQLLKQPVLTRPVSLRPNPARDAIWLDVAGNPNRTRVLVFDALGRRVLSATFNTNPAKISAKGLTPGVYLVRVEQGDRTEDIKLVIQR